MNVIICDPELKEKKHMIRKKRIRSSIKRVQPQIINKATLTLFSKKRANDFVSYDAYSDNEYEWEIRKKMRSDYQIDIISLLDGEHYDESEAIVAEDDDTIAYWSLLPKKIQQKIFSYLNFSDLLICSLVSQEWNIMVSLPMRNEFRHSSGNKFEKISKTITVDARRVLVDWLIEVQGEYNLSQTTLFLAVNYLDRFLSVQELPKNQLQLLGVCLLWIASKYEDQNPPTLTQLIFICDDAYEMKNILAMEQLILQVLKFELTAETPYNFLHRILNRLNIKDEKFTNITQFIAESTLLSTSFVNFLPSCIAASILYTTHHLFGGDDETKCKINKYSIYNINDIEIVECIELINNQLTNLSNSLNPNESTYLALIEKYEILTPGIIESYHKLIQII